MPGGEFRGADAVGDHLVRVRQHVHRFLEHIRLQQAAALVETLRGLVEDPVLDLVQIVAADAGDALLEPLLGGGRGGEVGGQLPLERGQPGVAEALQRADDGGVAGAAGRAQLLCAREEQILRWGAHQVLGHHPLGSGQLTPHIPDRGGQPCRPGNVVRFAHYSY